GVVGLPLHPAVPRPVVVAAILVAFPVGLVVLLVVGDEVTQGEAVMCGDEVDAGEGTAAVTLVEVAGAGEPVGEVGHAGGAPPPVVTDGVAVLAVPFRPQHREVAHLVAAHADVPWLG